MSLPILNSSKHASCRYPFWHYSLRTTNLIYTITIIILHPIGRIIGVGGRDGWAGEFTIEGGETLVSAVISSHTSSSSSKSLTMMTLSSLGSPRRLWLSSPNSLRANSSRVVLGRPSSSSEERSTTGITLEGPSCSRTCEGGLREDTSNDDIGGGRDTDGDGGGVEAPLDEDEELLSKELERLVPLFSSIANK
jgi:hypothetical protein